MTIKQKILEYVKDHPRETAFQIARGIGEEPATVSGRLVSMRRRDEVVIAEGHFGPRGGRTYVMPGVDPW